MMKWSFFLFFIFHFSFLFHFSFFISNHKIIYDVMIWHNIISSYDITWHNHHIWYYDKHLHRKWSGRQPWRRLWLSHPECRHRGTGGDRYPVARWPVSPAHQARPKRRAVASAGENPTQGRPARRVNITSQWQNLYSFLLRRVSYFKNRANSMSI